jgi:cytochrome c-type biogenesis protein
MMFLSFLEGVGHEAMSWVQGHPLGWWSPLFAFLLGVLNTLNPCTVSILPLWGLYLFGESPLNERTHASPDFQERLKGFRRYLHLSLLFTTGMVLALSVLGFMALQLRWVMFGAWNKPWVWVLAGTFTFVLGLSILQKWQASFQFQNATQGLFKLSQIPWLEALKPLLLGVSYAFILSPCSTPFLLALTVLLLHSPHPAVSLFSIVMYSVGQGVLFLVLPFILPVLQQRLESLWLERLQQASGWLLLLMGVWLMLFPILPMK